MKDAYYFSHDSNAKDDPKCVMLIEQLGLEGYGIFWVLIETLRDQPEYKYPLALIPAIARRYNTTAEKVKTVVCNYGLFEIDDNDFFSISLIKRMECLEEKRLKKSIAGKKGNEVRWQIAEQSQCDSNAIPTQSQIIASKVNKSKVNEIKEKENTIPSSQKLEDSLDNYLFEEFWDSYPKHIAKTKALKAWNARIKERIDPNDIIQAARNYAETRLGKDQQYTMYPATFLGPSKPFLDYLKLSPEITQTKPLPPAFQSLQDWANEE